MKVVAILISEFSRLNLTNVFFKTAMKSCRGNKEASKHACSINEDLLIRSISNFNKLEIFDLPQTTLLWRSCFDDAIEKNPLNR